MHSLTVLNMRLSHDGMNTSKNSYGFMPDIMFILKKYGLIGAIDTYLREDTFPTKNKGKRLVRQSLLSVEQSCWRQRMCESHDFSRVVTVHPKLCISNIWTTAKTYLEYFSLMKFGAKLICKKMACVSH